MPDRSVLRDGVLLSIGTLTAVRVPSPHAVDRARGGVAMIVAPLAVLPLAATVGLIGWLGPELDVTASVVGVLCVVALALGTRALHLDGLSDVADALTASHDADRSLEVMKDSAAGPAGAASLVLTLLLQAVAAGSVLVHDHGWLVVALWVCVSRATLALTCARPVPPARDSGLAVSYAGTVSVAVAAATWIACAAAAAGVFALSDLAWWRGPVAVAVALVVALIVLRRCVRRFGGVTGDVFGAVIEITFAVLLAASTTQFPLVSGVSY